MGYVFLEAELREWVAATLAAGGGSRKADEFFDRPEFTDPMDTGWDALPGVRVWPKEEA